MLHSSQCTYNAATACCCSSYVVLVVALTFVVGCAALQFAIEIFESNGMQLSS